MTCQSPTWMRANILRSHLALIQSRYWLVYFFAFELISPGLLISNHNVQRVDLEHHTWANYFLAAYKVSLFAACLPAMSLVTLPHIQDHCCARAVVQLTKDYADDQLLSIITSHHAGRAVHLRGHHCVMSFVFSSTVHRIVIKTW